MYVCDGGVGRDSDKIVRLHYSLPAGGTQNNKVGLKPRGEQKNNKKKDHPRFIPMRRQPCNSLRCDGRKGCCQPATRRMIKRLTSSLKNPDFTGKL